MERAVIDVTVYTNTLIDQLIRIKDNHRDILTRTEVDALNAACNIIEHNIKELRNV